MANKLNIKVPDIGVPDGDRPDGYYLNEDTGVPGTPILAEMKNDIYTFFSKMMEEGNVAFNNLTDTNTLSQYYLALEKNVLKYKNITTEDLRSVEGREGFSIAEPIGYKSVGDVLGIPTYHWDQDSLLDDNGGSIIKPDSILPADPGRWVWAERINKIISARMYGAVGVGDETAIIQNLLDNEIYVDIDVPCNISSVALRSFHKVIISDVVTSTDSPAFSIDGLQEVIIDFKNYGKIVGDDSTDTQECFLINDSRNININYALIDKFLNKGIAIGGTSTLCNIYKPKVRGAVGTTGAGVSLFGADVKYNKIDHPDCSQNRIGVTLNGCYYNEVNFPIANACTSSGVSIDGIISGSGDGGKYNKINHPVCNDGTDVTKGGVFCGNGSDYNEIIHPICNNNAGAGIRFSGGSANKNIHNSIIDPICIGNGTNGMTFSWCPYMKIVNPTVKDNTGRGITEVDSEGFMILGGVVDNNTTDGILHQSPNTIDDKVTVSNNGADGVEIAFGGTLGIGENRTINCNLFGNSGLQYKPAGTAKAFNCTGYITDNKGVDNKSDTQTIGHGLSAVPNFINATGSVAGEIITVTAKDSSTFTVAIKKDGGTAGTLQDIYWEASLY